MMSLCVRKLMHTYKTSTKERLTWNPKVDLKNMTSNYGLAQEIVSLLFRTFLEED